MIIAGGEEIDMKGGGTWRAGLGLAAERLTFSLEDGTSLSP